MMAEKNIHNRVESAAHELGGILMNLSRAQWLATTAAYNIRMAQRNGTASDVAEAEFAARDALQQANNLISHVRFAFNRMELPL
jgi:hypothetical protein